ncbi:hypothetical protein BDW72DRAFT_152270 [Aspergillus terricola var. indicus]
MTTVLTSCPSIMIPSLTLLTLLPMTGSHQSHPSPGGAVSSTPPRMDRERHHGSSAVEAQTCRPLIGGNPGPSAGSQSASTAIWKEKVVTLFWGRQTSSMDNGNSKDEFLAGERAVGLCTASPTHDGGHKTQLPSTPVVLVLVYGSCSIEL